MAFGVNCNQAADDFQAYFKFVAQLLWDILHAEVLDKGNIGSH